MQIQQVRQEARPQQIKHAREVAVQHLRHADLVMPVRLLQEREVAFETVLALPALDLGLDAREVGGKLEGLAVAKPYVVVWFAFHQVDAFRFEGRA